MAGRSSLPAGPVAGRPSLPGGPCRKAVVLQKKGYESFRPLWVLTGPKAPYGEGLLREEGPSLAGRPLPGCGRLVGATSWKRGPLEIGQECAPNPLSYDKI